MRKEAEITGDKYFDYNELIHYKIEDVGDISILSKNQHTSEFESLKSGIILRNIPDSLADTSFIDFLEKIGYTKTIIKPHFFFSIDSIFIEKKHPEPIYATCIHIYRDILIFKKNSKIVGIAKICFECGGNKILGTKSNTNEFGQSGDYWKLKEILNQN